MVDVAIVRAVQGYLRECRRRGFGVCFAVVFGSHAAGQPTAWSDIDAVVVSPRFDNERRREDVALL